MRVFINAPEKVVFLGTRETARAIGNHLRRDRNNSCYVAYCGHSPPLGLLAALREEVGDVVCRNGIIHLPVAEAKNVNDYYYLSSREDEREYKRLDGRLSRKPAKQAKRAAAVAAGVA